MNSVHCLQAQMQSDLFMNRSVFFSKKVFYKLSLCENFQRQLYKAFTGLSNHVRCCCRVYVCYFACFMFACNPVRLSLESIKGNLLTYLLK